jgi:UDP-N-acetylglucosamine--N-acetylmuramyl-(pentapeptide) pyrophosphoryl-undecaprenol N-acetylglucosamine transferase
MERAGASRMVLNQDLSGRRLFDEITNLADHPATLSAMAAAARSLAKPGAAKRAADILESIAR